MCDLRKFREVNNLTQTELGEYIDMKKSFISKIENGKEKLPALKLQKLLSNPNGWDTSMLINGGIYAGNNNGGNVNVQVGQNKIESRNGADNSAMQIAVLEKENEMLREQLKDKEAQIDFLRALVKNN